MWGDVCLDQAFGGFIEIYSRGGQLEILLLEGSLKYKSDFPLAREVLEEILAELGLQAKILVDL